MKEVTGLHILKWFKDNRVFTMSFSHSYPLVRIGIINCMYPWFISPARYKSIRTFSWGYGDCSH